MITSMSMAALHFFKSASSSCLPKPHSFRTKTLCFSSLPSTTLPISSPDLSRLAQTARISLTPDEIQEFAPKIEQVIDWFGQLQSVDLNNVEPSIRPDTEAEILGEDNPETFGNKEAIIASIPSYVEPYIKVPKVLNKE